MRCLWFIVVLIAWGCSHEKPEMRTFAPDSTESAPVPTPVPETPPVSLIQENQLSDEQLMRLFSSTWKVDEQATLEYADNAANDHTELKSWAMQRGVEWSMSCSFKNEGLQCTTSQKEFMIDSPVSDETFNHRIHIIDNDSFALRYDSYWLVFKSQ